MTINSKTQMKVNKTNNRETTKKVKWLKKDTNKTNGN